MNFGVCFEYVNELSSATLLGGDEIYLLAHDTNTSPNKSKIDLNNTLYGITNDKIVGVKYPKLKQYLDEFISLKNNL